MLTEKENISDSVLASIAGIKWNYRHLLLVPLLIPFIIILWKFDYHTALALFSFCFFLVLTLEAPKAALAAAFAILALDMNPSTCEYDPDSIFTFIISGRNRIPLHLFFEAGMLTGWLISRGLETKFRLKLTFFHWIILALAGWMCLGQINLILNGFNPLKAVFALRHILSYLMFFFIFDVLEDEKDIKTIFYIVVLGILVTFFVGFFRLATDQYIQWGFRRFYLWHEQVQTMHLLGLFALLAGMEKQVKFPFLAGLAIYLACLVQTFLSTSRAVLVGTLITLLLVLFLKIKSKTMFFVTSALFIVAMFFSIDYLTSKITGAVNEVAVESMDRIKAINPEEADYSVLFRLLSFQSAFLTAVEHPILGIGFNTPYELDIFGFKYKTLILDNTYIKFALSSGFPLLIIYLIFLIVVYRTGVRLLRKYPPGIIRVIVLSCIGVISMSNVVDLFQANFALFRIMFLIILAVSIIMKLDYIADKKSNK